MQQCIHKTNCRVCGGTDLVKVLDLGMTPPANAYLRKEDLDKPEASFPLALYFCRTCSLAQLLDVVDPEILFKDYHFLTGASAPSVAHFKKYVNDVVLPLVESPQDLLIDIGGNDGVLLSFAVGHARVLNVDPADNLSTLSEEKGVPFYPAFFTSRIADDIIAKYGMAKVVVANNVFAHTDPIRDVFEGVAKLIGKDGTFIFEVHWVKHLVEEMAFDQIYHEHLCFYSLHAIKHLVEATGMKVFDVEVIPTQGQSLRVYVSRSKDEKDSVGKLLEIERSVGLTKEQTFLAFGERVSANREKLRTLLLELKKDRASIIGYGAPAKGNTLLNYYGIGPDILDYLTDTTLVKQGLFSPGMHIPIVSPDNLSLHTPEYALLLSWNFKDEILEKETILREKGMKFIVTVPNISIIGN